MKIAVAFDHAGFRAKQDVVKLLTSRGHEVVEFGPDSSSPVDYPDFAAPASKAVAKGDCQRGIFVCGTGIGVSIVANKVPGVRAALCHDEYTTRVSRTHNDANVLCLGTRVLGREKILELVKVWLDTNFEGGRHERRLKKIEALEKELSPGLHPPSSSK